MIRPFVVLAALTLAAAGPALAQERGGLRPFGPPAGATGLLTQIEGNRGCPLSSTTVAMGSNRAFAPGSAVSQQAGSFSSGCHPLVSTQVVAGTNLALGRGAQAEQTLLAQGPRGVLATNRVTRGANIAVGAQASATQRLLNLTTP